MAPGHPQKSSDADSLARLNEERSKQAAEHIEKMRKYNETPIDAASLHHVTGTPRFTVTISGSPTLSLSAQSYIIDAHLYYTPDSGTQQVTIRNGGVPGSGWVADEIYLFYNTDGHVLEYEEIDKNIDDDEVAVRAENGFSSLGPGETITRQVEIWLRWWSGLKVGGRYKLLMPRGYIGWWDYGAMECHKDREIGPSDEREDGVLQLSRSNSIVVEVVT